MCPLSHQENKVEQYREMAFPRMNEATIIQKTVADCLSTNQTLRNGANMKMSSNHNVDIHGQDVTALIETREDYSELSGKLSPRLRKGGLEIRIAERQSRRKRGARVV